MFIMIKQKFAFAGALTALTLAAALLAGCGAPAAQTPAAPDVSKPAVSQPAAPATGSATGPITVISREEGSGTRGAFIELLKIEQKDADGQKVDYTTEEANITNSTAVMMTSVSGDTAAIGYISLGSLNDTVKALEIDGVPATAENIKAGTYKVARPFNIVTGAKANDAAKEFVAFILSADGQAVVAENGYIPLENAPVYTATGATGSVVIAGSSSITPVMEKLREAYAAVNPDISIEIQQSDSTTGMQSAIDGICDIGMASRALSDNETAAGLTGTVIATDGIAVIANLENPLAGLTAEQVKQIFTGEVPDWESLA